VSGRELDTVRELKAEDYQGVEYCVPMLSEWKEMRHRKSSNRTRVTKPAFNGYIFAVNALPYWLLLRDHRRLRGVVCYMAEGYLTPHLVKASEVEGVVFDGHSTFTAKLADGTQVKVTKGPFAGLNGVVIRGNLIELNLFQQKTRVKIPDNMLSKI